MQTHHKRPFGLWHVGVWLAAAGFAAPAGAGAALPAPAVSSPPFAADAVAPSTLAAPDSAAEQTVATPACPSAPAAPACMPASPDPLTAPGARFAVIDHASSSSARSAGSAEWQSVDDGALDAARGGFTNDNGLMVSLGIDRLVSINGEVVARTRIEIADLSRISAEQARQTSAALSAVKLVQNGGENIFRAADLGAALGGIVVQNSLNNQAIRTDTVISSTVNSAGLLNALNFHGTLQDALTRSVGQP